MRRIEPLQFPLRVILFAIFCLAAVGLSGCGVQATVEAVTQAVPTTSSIMVVEDGCIISDLIPLRSGPGVNHKISFMLRRGTLVQSISISSDMKWYQVQIHSQVDGQHDSAAGQTGWVAADFLAWPSQADMLAQFCPEFAAQGPVQTVTITPHPSTMPSPTVWVDEVPTDTATIRPTNGASSMTAPDRTDATQPDHPKDKSPRPVIKIRLATNTPEPPKSIFTPDTNILDPSPTLIILEEPTETEPPVVATATRSSDTETAEPVIPLNPIIPPDPIIVPPTVTEPAAAPTSPATP